MYDKGELFQTKYVVQGTAILHRQQYSCIMFGMRSYDTLLEAQIAQSTSYAEKFERKGMFKKADKHRNKIKRFKAFYAEEFI